MKLNEIAVNCVPNQPIRIQIFLHDTYDFKNKSPEFKAFLQRYGNSKVLLIGTFHEFLKVMI